jgi:hypothetical protein
MFAFNASFSLDDVRRVSERMKNPSPANAGAEHPLSDKSRRLVRSVRFSSSELNKAASNVAISSATPPLVTPDI